MQSGLNLNWDEWLDGSMNMKRIYYRYINY